MKIKDFCSLSDTFKNMKKQATDWEKVFAKHTFDKGLFPGICSTAAQ